MINITPTQLRKAADIKERIDALQNELTQLLGSSGPAETAMIEAPRKYKFSAAARAKMRAAQEARWARIKGTAPSAKPAKKAKRKMSAQGLANIRAGVAKRMAAQARAGATKPVKKAKKHFSAAARAALAAAAKARWAKVKAAGKSRL
jgi:ABC-type uncharacterized transport system involved in gliding motility auxiliary subunit